MWHQNINKSKSKLAGMNSWEQRGRARQNYHVRSSSGSRQIQVMYSHEDICYSRLRSDPKGGGIHIWTTQIHSTTASLQVQIPTSSRTTSFRNPWVVQTKDSLYNNCIEKTFMFLKPSTQALLWCDVYLSTGVNKKTSLWTSEVDKAERVQESRMLLHGRWQVKKLTLKQQVKSRA